MQPAPFFEGPQRLLFSCLQWGAISEESFLRSHAARWERAREVARRKGDDPDDPVKVRGHLIALALA